MMGEMFRDTTRSGGRLELGRKDGKGAGWDNVGLSWSWSWSYGWNVVEGSESKC